ncbi:MAG: phosphate ABC transporter permease PstA [Gammaproteobacteria bacterium]|nr:phosphate ABC transporter permease PstA [Gammaproteobacteria bacterium]
MRDAVMTALVYLCALTVFAVLVWIIADVVLRGAGSFSFTFLVSEPLDAGRAGGIGPIVVSTILILVVCLCAALPIGLGAAIFLSEFTRGDRASGHFVRSSLDVLAGVPSIVFGLFGTVLFCEVLGLGFSILSGGLTLACMILPLLIRTTELGLRSVSAGDRLGAAALALSKTTTLRWIILPVAAPAIIAGTVLGLGRAIAETAALIFTSGYVSRMPESLMDSGRALSVHIFDLAMNVPNGDESAYASALVLIVLLIAVNLTTASVTTRVLAR